MKQLAILVFSVWLIGCGGNDSSNVDAQSPDEAAATIGPEGGTVATPDGARVTLPPGAVTEPTLITIAKTGESIPSALGLGVGAVYQLGPSGTVFSVPVAVTLPFAAAAIPVGGAASDLIMVTASDGTADYTSLGAVTTSGAFATAQTTHFSLFGPAFRASLPGGPLGGYVTFDISGFTAQNPDPGASVQAALDATEADVMSSILMAEFIVTAGGIPLGSCGGSFAPPPGATQGLPGVDVGTVLELLDGGTVVSSLPESTFTNGLYVSSDPNVSSPFIGKTLSLSAPQATTVNPTVIPDLLVIPDRAVWLSPAPNSQVVKGQPLTVTWTPLAADTLIITSYVGAAICNVDPMAGTFTIPGSATSTYVLTGLMMIPANKRARAVEINGTSRSVVGYATAISGLPAVFVGSEN